MCYTCSICLSSLTETEDNIPSAPPCGHTFHYTCLIGWCESLGGALKKCPLCKRNFRNSQIVRLYLSSDDSSQRNDNPAPSNPNNVYQQMLENGRLQEQINNLKKDGITMLKKYQDEEQKALSMETKYQEMTRKIRYLKQVKRVADLDDDMTTPCSRSFFEKINRLGQSDLVVTAAGLATKLQKAGCERNKYHKMYSSKVTEVERLKEELKKLRQQFNIPQDQEPESSSNNNNNNNENVIVLDSDSDDELESMNIRNSLERSNSSGSVMLIDDESNNRRMANRALRVGGPSSRRLYRNLNHEGRFRTATSNRDLIFLEREGILRLDSDDDDDEGFLVQEHNTNMNAFRNHRNTPSEGLHTSIEPEGTVSDVS